MKIMPKIIIGPIAGSYILLKHNIKTLIKSKIGYSILTIINYTGRLKSAYG